MKTDKNTNFLNESWNGMTHGEVSEQLRTLLKDMIDDIVTASQSSSVGIADITTSESQEDGGVNTITITLTDGTVKTVSVRNGQSGGMVSTVDTAARAAIMELYRNLAGIAFVGDKPGISFNATSFQVQVFSSNLQGCVIAPHPESVSYGGRVVIAIRPAEGKTLDKVTLTDANIISRGAQSVTSHGYNSSTGDYEIVFDNVIGDINITVQNVTAADIPANQVSLNIDTTGCSVTGVPADGVYLGDSFALYFTPETNYTFGSSADAVDKVQVVMTGSGTVSKSYENGAVKVEISGVSSSIRITAVAYETFAVRLTPSNCHASGTVPGRVIKNSRLDITLVADEGYTMDGATVSVKMGGVTVNNAYNNGQISILNVTGDVVITAAAAQQTQPVATGIPVVLKLLNITPSNGNDIQQRATGSNYYSDTIDDTNSGYTVDLDVDSGCYSNDDLTVRAGGALLELDTDYEFEDGKLTIYAAALTSEIIITMTARTKTLTVTLADGATAPSLYCGSTDLVFTNGVATVTGLDSISSLGCYVNGQKQPKLINVTSIESIDFGGIPFKATLLQLFQGCTGLTEVKGLVVKSAADTSEKSMQNTFSGCTNLEEIDTIGWDLSNVTSLTCAFFNCKKLTELDLDYMDVGNVKYFNNSDQSCFAGCEAITTLGVRGWSNNKTTSLQALFYRCKALTALDLSAWNFTKAESLYGMFASCTAVTSIDMRGISTEAASLTSLQNLFANCSNLNEVHIGALNVGANVNISNIGRVVNLYCHETEPPTLSTNWVSAVNPTSIYVPAASVDDYKAAAGWSAFTDKIKPIPSQS